MLFGASLRLNMAHVAAFSTATCQTEPGLSLFATEQRNLGPGNARAMGQVMELVCSGQESSNFLREKAQAAQESNVCLKTSII